MRVARSLGLHGCHDGRMLVGQEGTLRSRMSRARLAHAAHQLTPAIQVLLLYGWALAIVNNLANVLDSVVLLQRQIPAMGTDYFNTLVPAIHGDPYAVSAYVFSPLAVYAAIPLVAVGFRTFTALKFALLPLVGDIRLIVTVLLFFPWWQDVLYGETDSIAFILAAWALRGSRIGTWVFFAATFLMPRPLMFPVVLFILATRRDTCRAFVAIALLNIVGVLASGHAVEWLHRLTVAPQYQFVRSVNVTPSAWIGGWWILGAAPLALWFTYRGRLGLAAIAASFYLHTTYGIFLLLECLPTRPLGPILPEVWRHRREPPMGNAPLPQADDGVLSWTGRGGLLNRALPVAQWGSSVRSESRARSIDCV
jgi:hypothetical protein